jgi:hypothetical protein
VYASEHVDPECVLSKSGQVGTLLNGLCVHSLLVFSILAPDMLQPAAPLHGYTKTDMSVTRLTPARPARVSAGSAAGDPCADAGAPIT